jgi:PhnB protein
MQAIAFYEKVFNTKCTAIMKYGDMPPDDSFPMNDEIKDLVMNANLKIHGTNIMLGDVPDGMGMDLTLGNNITVVVDTNDELLLEQEFKALSVEGVIVMPLDKTFWSDKYGYVVDKFGIGWQFNLSKDL